MSDTPTQNPAETQTIELWPGMVAEVMTPENHLIFVGRVDKIRDEGVYICELNDDTLPMVLVNQPVKVRFYRETDNIVLHAKVAGSTDQMWKIDQLQSAFAREKRGSFRQNISIDIEARCGKCSGRDWRPDKLFPCRMLDISVGGALVSCEEAFQEGDRLVITEALLVPNAPAFTFRCQIRRADEWNEGVNRYGCQFDTLAPRDQDRLLQAIFSIQREEIKKRRGRR